MKLPPLHLQRLRPLQLDSGSLNARIDELREVTGDWQSGGDVGTSGPVDELRQRVRRGVTKGEKFEIYTAVKRREALLLSLYLNDLGSPESAEKLPPFDNRVAESVLGAVPSNVRKHIRRLATQLYFTHYNEERIPALTYLTDFLRVSWGSAEFDPALDRAAREWHENADKIFHRDAPEKVAECWDGTWTVDQLADQLFIHQDGLFRDRLWEAIALRRLHNAPRGAFDPELDRLVTDAKERPLSNGHRLGAEAVKILVTRARTEFGSRLPPEWGEQVVTFACDPRITNNTEKARWWGWATSTEKDIAIQALSALTLQQFIELLERSLRGTTTAHQFPERKRVLLKLFELGFITEARLVVHRALYREMDAKTRSVLMPSRTSGGNQQTSFICLRCSNDVFLIEGTHNFGLRGFIGRDSFPIRSFWEAGPKLYDDKQLRVPIGTCDIYQVHHQGNWAWDFNNQLRHRGIEWRGF